ncbi:MAG: COX15/CtaA family protein [Phycisphaerales bacterium]
MGIAPGLNDTPTAHRRIAYAALALAYLQIVFGGIVRISGSGMGCGDDWPKCLGSFFPPLSRPDLVIELTHRYLAVAVSLAVAALVIAAFRVPVERTRTRKPPMLSLALVIAAALLGAASVKLALSPLVVVAHLAIAMTLLGTLAWSVVAAGGFGATGGLYIARWNGSTWSSFGGGLPEEAFALAVLPNGDLIASGNMNQEGIGYIWRWNGAAWSTLEGELESGPMGWAQTLAVLPGGDLVAGGFFSAMFRPGLGMTPVANVARWNGSTWSGLGSGVNSTVNLVFGLPEDEVLVGGQFTFAGTTPVQFIATWTGAAWSPMGTGFDWSPRAVLALPDGDMIVGGDFLLAGSVRADRIARRRAGVWEPMGTGMNATVRALALMPNGDVIAGGDFTVAGGAAARNIARWDGGGWVPLGAGVGVGFVGTRVHAIALLPSGDLVVGGDFTTAGSIEAENVARWDGGTWHSMGQDLGPFQGPGLDDAVWALAVLPNGQVIAGGDFGNGTGQSPPFIARFSGSSWQSMGPGVNSTVYSLAAAPNGDLIAGGEFTSPGAHIARWNGSSWSALGAGVGGGGGFPTVHAIQPIGADIFATGDFTTAGGAPANRIARWDGSVWSTLGSGLVSANPAFGAGLGLTVQPGGALVAVGGFFQAGGVTSAGVATWACTASCYPNCDGSTQAPVLNVADFGCFLTRYAAGDAYANCDGSTQAPVLNVADFGCFLTRYAAGCGR